MAQRVEVSSLPHVEVVKGRVETHTRTAWQRKSGEHVPLVIEEGRVSWGRESGIEGFMYKGGGGGCILGPVCRMGT